MTLTQALLAALVVGVAALVVLFGRLTTKMANEAKLEIIDKHLLAAEHRGINKAIEVIEGHYTDDVRSQILVARIRADLLTEETKCQ